MRTKTAVPLRVPCLVLAMRTHPIPLPSPAGFTAYEMGTRIYRDSHGGAAPPPHLRGVIGACSAACVMTLTLPLEVVRRRLQIQASWQG